METCPSRSAEEGADLGNQVEMAVGAEATPPVEDRCETIGGPGVCRLRVRVPSILRQDPGQKAFNHASAVKDDPGV